MYASDLSRATIERIIDRFRDAGFGSTATDTARIEYSVESGYDRNRESATPNLASSAVAERGSGTVYLSLDGFELELHFDLENEESPKVPLHVYGLEGALLGDDVSEAAVKRRCEPLVEGIAGTAVETDSWGVVGTFINDGLVVGFPSDPPPEATLSELAWVTVFGSDWCDQLGGRDRLLKAPVWNTRPLENGAVVMRKTELPDPGWRSNSVLSKKVVVDPTDYVFEGWTTTDPNRLREKERRRSEREYLDPFRSFEEGEYGTDILLCKSHAPFDIGETEYAGLLDTDLHVLDRCQVLKVRRRGDTLRVAESGEFVRRLVDDDGRPIGDRPDEVPSEHEMLSLTIMLEDQRENPPSWYRMDDLDDKSISARLNSFLVLSRKNSSIWQDE